MTIPTTEPPSDTIKHIRKYCGYSQDTLAGMLGVSKGTIERIERGERVGNNLPTNYRVYVLATERIRELYREATK